MSEVALPSGWCVATIMDVARSAGGGTPSKSDPSYWLDGTLPWISPKDMKVFLVGDSEDKVTAKALDRLTLIPDQSVLVVVRSGILSRTLPVAISQCAVTINQDMRAFLPAASIDARYIAWQLVSKERDILDRCAKDGTTVASIEGPALAAYPLFVAPSNEQTRIVDKLEELLSDLDAGVAELKAAQRKLAQYRQSLLKAAVEGTLTAEWRADRAKTGEPQETGVALLRRILIERRARWEASQLAKFAEQDKTPPKDWQAKYKEPVAPDTTDLPALPEGWMWASVEQLAELVSGHTPKDADQFSDQAGDVHWFKVGDMNQEGNEEWMSVSGMRFTKEIAAKLGLKLAPAGTIVFPKRGGAIATNKKRRLAAAGTYDLNMMGLVAGPLVQDWLWSWFMGIDLAKLSDGSNVPQINNPDIAPLWVPIPPEDEQRCIRENLSSLLESMRDQETATEHLLKQSAAQRKNILKGAFAGQLVPQDPNDEPASVLLERIRAARAASGTTTRARKARTTA